MRQIGLVDRNFAIRASSSCASFSWTEERDAAEPGAKGPCAVPGGVLTNDTLTLLIDTLASGCEAVVADALG